MDYLDIYKKTFAIDSYSNEHHIQYDFIVNELKKIYSDIDRQFKLIDIGSGRGQVLSYIKNIYTNANITSVDLEKFNNIKIDNFIKCDLSNQTDRNNICGLYDILICTDVFEHLDKSFIEDVINMCSKLSNKCIFGIANHSDIQNGIELHTIQENDLWWDKIILKYFNINDKLIKYDGRLFLYVCEKK